MRKGGLAEKSGEKWACRVSAQAAHTRVWIVGEAKALGTACFRVVDEAESFDFADAAEYVGDLLLGEAWSIVVSARVGRVGLSVTVESVPYGMLPTKTTRDGGLVDIMTDYDSYPFPSSSCKLGLERRGL